VNNFSNIPKSLQKSQTTLIHVLSKAGLIKYDPDNINLVKHDMQTRMIIKHDATEASIHKKLIMDPIHVL
jgi:hypothetical protein